MPSKQLRATWAALNIALLAAAAFLISFSVIWRSHNLLRNFVISEMDLNAGLALGILFLVTWVLSIAGILQRDHVTMPLIATSWALLADVLATVIIGCIIWDYTLTPTKNFFKVWQSSSPSTQQAIQDSLHCCGFLNGTDPVVPAGYCADASFASTQPGCSTVILPYAAYTLQNIFSSVFGLMVVIVGFFLATVCVVNRRKRTERFRRIDEKRGGRGFV